MSALQLLLGMALAILAYRLGDWPLVAGVAGVLLLLEILHALDEQRVDRATAYRRWSEWGSGK